MHPRVSGVASRAPVCSPSGTWLPEPGAEIGQTYLEIWTWSCNVHTLLHLHLRKESTRVTHGAPRSSFRLCCKLSWGKRGLRFHIGNVLVCGNTTPPSKYHATCRRKTLACLQFPLHTFAGISLVSVRAPQLPPTPLSSRADGDLPGKEPKLAPF